MDILNVLKITTAIITVFFTFLAAYIELRRNPDYWLNRWFALFFSSMGVGFLLYTVYHFITTAPAVIIPFMISAHVLFNFGVVCLLMTTFILDKSEKLAMSKKYLGIILLLFFLSIIGYFIWTPTLNMERFDQGIVDTETPTIWFVFVNAFRLIVLIYVLVKYGIIARKSQEPLVKKKVSWFLGGSIINVIGILLNLFGGLLGSPWFEILGLMSFNAGAIAIVKGFLLE